MKQPNEVYARQCANATRVPNAGCMRNIPISDPHTLSRGAAQRGPAVRPKPCANQLTSADPLAGVPGAAKAIVAGSFRPVTVNGSIAEFLSFQWRIDVPSQATGRRQSRRDFPRVLAIEREIPRQQHVRPKSGQHSD
jgi:hypothetical protein